MITKAARQQHGKNCAASDSVHSSPTPITGYTNATRSVSFSANHFSAASPMLRVKEERRDGRSIFQPIFGLNGDLERSARTRFRGCRFGSLSQSLFSQPPVRLVTINHAQGENKGRRRVSIGNTLAAEVTLDFIVPKDHSVKVVRLSSFVERAGLISQI